MIGLPRRWSWSTGSSHGSPFGPPIRHNDRMKRILKEPFVQFLVVGAAPPTSL